MCVCVCGAGVRFLRAFQSTLSVLLLLLRAFSLPPRASFSLETPLPANKQRIASVPNHPSFTSSTTSSSTSSSISLFAVRDLDYDDVDGEDGRVSGVVGGEAISSSARSIANANAPSQSRRSLHGAEETAWAQIGSDMDGEGPDDQSGWSVSISHDGLIVAIGATHNDGNGAQSGHTRVYSRTDRTIP